MSIYTKLPCVPILTQHGDERHKVVAIVDAEHSKGLPVDVGVPQTASLDDGPDVVTLLGHGERRGEAG